MSWMRLPEEYSKEDSYFCIFPIRFEGKVTYGKGASKGPDAIIEASEHLEYYDEQFKVEPFEKGIFTKDMGDLMLDQDSALKQIELNYPKNNFVIALGGDHSVTIACAEQHDADVLIFDAHSDLRDSWNNSSNNHACVSKVLSKDRNVGIVGVRSQDKDEVELQPENVHVLHSYNINEKAFQEVLDKLNKKVYISIDVDVFDPSFIRNTGTPEPGGLMWNELINLLKKTFEQKEVVGADIVEFSPNENFTAEAYSVAKLAHKLMAMKIVPSNSASHD